MIPLQATPAATAGEAATSPWTYLVLVGIVLWAVERTTEYDPITAARSLISRDDDDASMAGETPSPGFGLLRPRTLVIAGVSVLLFLVFTGALGLPSSIRVQLAAGLVLLGSYLTLRGLGAYSFRMFLVVGVGVVILGLSALGEPIIGGLARSPVFPIVALGGLYLAYKAIQKYRGGGGGGTKYVVVKRGDGQ